MMLGRQSSASASRGRARDTGIEDIARRLDELVQTVSRAPISAVPPTVQNGILPAAQQALKAERERRLIFGATIVADPAWSILLNLFVARIERREITVSELCSTGGLASPTALRWVAHLIEAKLVTSASNAARRDDRRLELTDEGVTLMGDYFLRTNPDLDAAAA